MVGAGWQAHLQSRQLEREFTRQRALAQEDHARKQVVVENEHLRSRIAEQLAHGRKVMLAGARFKSFAKSDASQEDLTRTLFDAVKFAGLEFDAVSPFPEFVTDVEIEDSDLRAMIDEHRRITLEVESVVAFLDARPADLPPDYFKLMSKVDDLARRIGRRCRDFR